MSLNWILIVGLAIFGLIRHLLDVLNIVEMAGGMSSALVTVAISVVWVGVVLRKREPKPLGTLAAVGFIHGLLVILLALVTPIIPTGPEGFVAPLGLIGILGFNTAWGVLLGAIVQLIQPDHSRRTTSRG